MRRQSFGTPARLLVALALTAAALLIVAVAVAQPDPYGDEPAAPAKARPAPKPKAPAAKPKAHPRPAPKPLPSARHRPDPNAPGSPAGRLRPPTRRPRRPPPPIRKPGAHPGAADHGSHAPAGHDAHGEGEHGGHEAHCPGHGPTDRPGPINLLHGWLGVNNDKAVPPPAGAHAGSWDWWAWRLTPYLWRYDNHDDHCDPRNQPTPLIAPIFNFAVLAFILFRFGRKPLQDALRKRKVSIMSEIESAQDIKDKAEDRLDHFESELDHLDEKLDGLRDQYAAEAADEKKGIVTDAGEARDRMMADADFRVSQEGKVARDELSREAMEKALAAAEALLKERVTAQDHDRLGEEFLQQIGPALRERGLSDTKGGRQ